MYRFQEAADIAGSYNRMLLSIQNGENNEYPDLDSYLGSLGIDPVYIQQVETDSRGRIFNRFNDGVSIMIAGGGPTVWINTSDGMIYASTSGACVGVSLFSEVRDEINDLYGIEF